MVPKKIAPPDLVKVFENDTPVVLPAWVSQHVHPSFSQLKSIFDFAGSNGIARARSLIDSIMMMCLIFFFPPQTVLLHILANAINRPANGRSFVTRDCDVHPMSSEHTAKSESLELACE